MSDPEVNGSEQQEAPRAEPPAPDAPSRPTIADAITEFVQMVVDYVRQETGDVVHDKVVVPTQIAGQVVAFALAAALVLFLGIAYISVASMMLLAYFVGWIAALYIIGGIMVVGAAGLTYAKMRRIQQ